MNQLTQCFALFLTLGLSGYNFWFITQHPKFPLGYIQLAITLSCTVWILTLAVRSP